MHEARCGASNTVGEVAARLPVSAAPCWLRLTTSTPDSWEEDMLIALLAVLGVDLLVNVGISPRVRECPMSLVLASA